MPSGYISGKSGFGRSGKSRRPGMKHGQITIFIILGILILAAITVTNKIRVDRITKESQAAADTVVKELTQTDIINEYVTKCLDTTSEDALYLVEQQGGVIYPDQKGSLFTMTPRFITFTLGKNYSAKVAYGISVDRSYVAPQPPRYPCGKTGTPPGFCGYINNESIYPKFLMDQNKIRFGTDAIMPLCRTAKDCLYEYGTKVGMNSVQEQMENYIEKNVILCLNFSSFLTRLNHNVTVSGNPNVSVQFKRTSIEITMRYPINISFQSREPITRMIDFKVRKSSRFMSMYKVAYDMILKDIKNMSFIPMMEYTQMIDQYPYHIIHLRDYYMKEDIIRILNPDGFVKGNQEVFQFIIENRNPALDYIPGSLPVGKNYDIVITEGNSLVITPKGYDPDDDKITYHYYGWKADYNVTYVNSSNKYDYPNIWYRDSTGRMNKLGKLADVFQTGVNKMNPTYLSIVSLGGGSTPNLWEASTFYKKTNRSASYNLTRKDIGPHNVTIVIEDSGKLVDFQIVRVLVDDLQRANASLSKSLFDDLNAYYPDVRLASVEDPFILDASASSKEVNVQANVLYEWTDQNETPVVLVSDTTEKISYFPGKSTELDIKMMPSLNFNNGPKGTARSILHFIRLTTKTEGMASIAPEARNMISVEMFRCLPHRSQFPAFPYSGNADPFMANHVCCEGEPAEKDNNALWGTYSPVTKTCYSQQVSIGRKFSETNPEELKAYLIDEAKICGLDKSTATCYDKINNIDFMPIIRYINQQRDANNIPKLFVERKCSGDRGNICSGEFVINTEAGISCTQSVMPAWQTESCRGSVSGSTYCVNFDAGDSFEKSKGTGTGDCSSRTWCADEMGEKVALKSDGTDGKILTNPLCGLGECRSVQDANSFDCSSLDGTKIDNVETKTISQLKTIYSQILANPNSYYTNGFLKNSTTGKMYTYKYSCGGSGQAHCKRAITEDLSPYGEKIEKYLAGKYGSDSAVGGEKENLAYVKDITVRFTSYTDDSATESKAPGVCGLGNHEFVRKFCRFGELCGYYWDSYGNLHQASRIFFNMTEGRFDERDEDQHFDIDLELRSSKQLGCCYDKTDCYYEGTCFKSILGRSTLAFLSSFTSRNRFGLINQDNGKKYVCVDGKWFGIL